MKKIQLQYQIKNISTLFEEGLVKWHNAEFTFKKELTASLQIWEIDTEPEQIIQTCKKLEELGLSIQVAMKYLGNHSIVFKKDDYVTYHFDDQIFTLRNVEETECLIKYLRGEIESFCIISAALPIVKLNGSGTLSPIPLPKIMPHIHPDLHAKAAILIVADKLADYPDLQLKLVFLLMEDLIEKETLQNDNLKYVRDFVSHSTCKNKSLVNFISSELPSAKLNNGVSFNREKDNHMVFVSKYANISLQKAKELFDSQVEQLGGCVRY
jgi:hypothetical protein